jgi:hypothetical protein
MSGVPQFSQVLVSQKAAGSANNTYTTAKSVINATELVTLPANYLTIGSKFRIRGLLALSNIVTTPGTFALQVMMGTIVAFSSGNIQLNATAHTALPLDFEIELRVDSIGSGTAAKFMGRGKMTGIQPTLTAAQTDAANTSGSFIFPVTTPAVGTGFDSTIANILDFWVGFSISNAGNGVTVQDYLVEQLSF